MQPIRIFSALMVLGFFGISRSQTVHLPAPDQDGWIHLAPSDTANWYARLYDNPTKNVDFPNSVFTYTGDTIKGTGTLGHLAFKQAFSHYRIKLEMMVPDTTNCGLLLHIRENDPKLYNKYPRSVEFQGDPVQGLGELWTISNIFVRMRVDSKVTDGCTYDSTGDKTITHPLDAAVRVCNQAEDRFLGYGKWNQLEAVVDGADSISHIVNGVRVMHYTHLTIGKTSNAPPLDSGRFGIQSEGKTIFYRHIYIKILPGDPLYTPVSLQTEAQHASSKPRSRKILNLEKGVVGLRESETEEGNRFNAGGQILPTAKPK